MMPKLTVEDVVGSIECLDVGVRRTRGPGVVRCRPWRPVVGGRIRLRPGSACRFGRGSSRSPDDGVPIPSAGQVGILVQDAHQGRLLVGLDPDQGEPGGHRARSGDSRPGGIDHPHVVAPPTGGQDPHQ